MKFLKLIFVAAIAHFIIGCGEERYSFSRTYDLNDSKFTIGVRGDCDSEFLTRKIYRDAKICVIDSLDDAAKKLMAGKIDAIVYDEHVLRIVMWRYPDRFTILPDPVDTDPSVIAVSRGRKDLVKKLNRFIAEYKSNGVYNDMFLRWCHDPERGSTGMDVALKLPAVPDDAPLLRVGTDCDEEPNSFIDEKGRYAGFDIEFAMRFAVSEGMKAEIVCLPEADLREALKSGAIDIIVDNLDYRPDSRIAVYTDGYLDSDVVMMIRAEDEAK